MISERETEEPLLSPMGFAEQPNGSAACRAHWHHGWGSKTESWQADVPFCQQFAVLMGWEGSTEGVASTYLWSELFCLAAFHPKAAGLIFVVSFTMCRGERIHRAVYNAPLVSAASFAPGLRCWDKYVRLQNV